MRKILITVCGRAGSKGVKNKNFRMFLGRPLVYYTLRSAELFKADYPAYDTDVAISSDSGELLEYCDAYDGVDTVLRRRPGELSQDDTPKVPAIQDLVRIAEKERKKTYDYVIDLDITAPLRKTSDMERALGKLHCDEKLDLVFTAIPSRRNPYFNMVEVDGTGYAQKVKPSEYVCRQQAPDVFDMSPSVYCYKRDALMNKLERITFEGTQGLITIPETFVIDIDRKGDFEMLELLVKHVYATEYPELFSDESR